MRIIAYYRISTRRQKTSGLGLDAQREAVERYAKSIGARIVGEYTEQESGKRKDRPKLLEAISHARGAKATLVVAKLDRLARNVQFTATLMENKVDFVCCDNPHANRLTIHILAAVAENEAIAIARRTKEALAVAAARGVKLGSHRRGHWSGVTEDGVRRAERRLVGARKGQPRAVKAAAAERVQKAADRYSHLMPSIRADRANGVSLEAIAERLNSEGVTTIRETPITAVVVHRLLARYGS